MTDLKGARNSESIDLTIVQSAFSAALPDNMRRRTISRETELEYRRLISMEEQGFDIQLANGTLLADFAILANKLLGLPVSVRNELSGSVCDIYESHFSSLPPYPWSLPAAATVHPGPTPGSP